MPAPKPPRRPEYRGTTGELRGVGECWGAPARPGGRGGFRDDEQARERCGDRVLAGEPDELVFDFGRFAVATYLVEQVTNFTPGPYRRDEVMIRRALRECRFE